ncbi:MAG: hypothetical protein L0I62_05240, partial [Gammaproteobacteria bacterium]|nr:hypothetical protein [Gammaproteobacteria bacterium]
LLAAALFAGCSGAPDARTTSAAGMAAPGIVTVLVPLGEDAASLEIHLIPARDLGPAVLTVSGEHLEVLPAAERHFRLAPPAPPPPATHSPYPLPRILIEVFRLESPLRGAHTVTLQLSWQGGQLSRQITWTN